MSLILERTKKILVDRFAIDPTKIHPAVDLQKDLNMDSMDALDLLLAVNETFKIQISERSLDNIHTLSDLVACIERQRPVIRNP